MNSHDADVIVGASQVAVLAKSSEELIAHITRRIQRDVATFGANLDVRQTASTHFAVTRAVERFLAQLAHRAYPTNEVDVLFQKIGRREARERRNLDAIQAVWRVATDESWTHFRRLGLAQVIPTHAMPTLTQMLFDYIQHLAQQVTLGYRSYAIRPQQDDQQNSKQLLLARLLDGADGAAIEALATGAGWNAAQDVIVIRVDLCIQDRPAILWSHLTQFAHCTLIRDEIGALTVIAPAGRTHIASELLAVPGCQRIAYSWPIPLNQSRHAAQWVKRALRLAAHGHISSRGAIDCEEHRPLLCLHADPLLMQQTADELLAPLTRETPHSRTVLTSTLLLWLQTHASAPKLAQQLGVHEQTIRARMKRLHELFGPKLNDPRHVLALLMAFQVNLPQDNQHKSNDTSPKNTQNHDKNLG